MNINKDTIEDITIYKVITGSQSYGWATPESDIDTRGIAIVPDLNYYYGFIKKFEQYENKVKDIVIYDIRKFFSLARACNPSIIELLYIDDPKLILKTSKWFDIIKQNRDKFLSMKVCHTYSGYSYQQIQRIETHRKWLLNPPTHKPTREEFGLSDNTISFSQLQAMNKLINDGSVIEVNALELIKKENSYRNALTEYNQYENWKKTRNPKRAEMEREFGFDGKYALHAIRLGRQGKEILTTGKVIVNRPDKEDLYSIRLGKWSYEKVLNEAKTLESEMRELYKTPEKCAVPYTPDEVYLDNLCTDIVNDYMSIKKEIR